MEYIDSDAEIMEGDEIVTSNLSEYYPAGISIGYVREIHKDENGLTKYAVIEPTADLKHLGQRDFPGQFAAGFPLPALDGGGDLLHDLAVEVDSAYRLEGVGHRGS